MRNRTCPASEDRGSVARRFLPSATLPEFEFFRAVQSRTVLPVVLTATQPVTRQRRHQFLRERRPGSTPLFGHPTYSPRSFGCRQDIRRMPAPRFRVLPPSRHTGKAHNQNRSKQYDAQRKPFPVPAPVDYPDGIPRLPGDPANGFRSLRASGHSARYART